MKICTVCKKTANDNMNFCATCGAPLAILQQEPQAQQNTYYQAPVYNQNKAPLGLKISAMVLSISGFACLVLGFFYTLFGLIEEGLAFGMSFAFALFFLPLCIVGFALSSKCQNAGDTSAFSRVGKILGLIGIIISAVSLFIGIVSL